MNEFLSILSLLFTLILFFPFAYWLDVQRLKRMIKSYNKRYNANLDTSFKDLKKIKKDYDDWYLQYFIPDKKSKLSMFDATSSECEDVRKNIMGGYCDEE